MAGSTSTSGSLPPWLMTLSRNQFGAYALLVMSLLYAWALYRTAWLCDDAFITYRTVDNFLEGHGLTYNIHERVQAFTHPLWMFLHIPVYGILGDIYASGLFVSMTLSLGAVLGLAYTFRKQPWEAAVLVGSLAFSMAFTDFSTSGLENPLTHVLLLFFFREWTRSDGPRLKRLAFWVSLLMLNRMDTLLLALPAMVSMVWPLNWKKFRQVLTGFLPFLLWILFAVFYYGFPFPNTAYAKLGTGIPAWDLVERGLMYFVNSAHWDPITLILIASAIAVPILGRKRNGNLISLGILLYLLYILRIGGDFMSGRFLTPPLFLACLSLLVYRPTLRSGIAPALTLLVLLVNLIVPNAPVKSGADFGPDVTHVLGNNGIADERAFYYPGTGLLTAGQYDRMPGFRWADQGRNEMPKKFDVRIQSSIGMYGFFAGQNLHIVDRMGLADPLLSRLPVLYDPNWRQGHYYRVIPAGYPNSWIKGKNIIQDPELAEWYETMNLITRGPLFSWDRFKAIFRMNTGYQSKFRDAFRYRLPIRDSADIASVSALREPGTAWNAMGNYIFGQKGGLYLRTGSQAAYSEFEVSLDHDNIFIVAWLKGKEILGGIRVGPAGPGASGLHVYQQPILESARDADAMVVFPLELATPMQSLGHLRLLK